MVVAKQSAKPLAAVHIPRFRRSELRLNEFVLQSLVIALPMVVRKHRRPWSTGHPSSLHYNGVLALTIGLGIAIDDSLHFLYRYKYEMRAHGGDRPAAIAATFRSVGTALITTTVVLVSGLGILLFCSLPMARHFATLILEILVLALLCDLIILPSLLFWPRRNPAPTMQG